MAKIPKIISRENIIKDAANALKEGDDANYLRRTGHLPEAVKASYPDKPHDRPYEFLDILELAGVIPKTEFSDGREFSPAQRKILLQANMAKNGGKLKSDDPEDRQQVLSEQGTVNVPEVDHIIPKSLGGSNAYSNARVISWELNNVRARVKKIYTLIDVRRLSLPRTNDLGEQIWHAALRLPAEKVVNKPNIINFLFQNYNLEPNKRNQEKVSQKLDSLVSDGRLVRKGEIYEVAEDFYQGETGLVD